MHWGGRETAPQQGVSDFVLIRYDERLTIFAREHGVGRRVADELLPVRIELKPGAQGTAIAS